MASGPAPATTASIAGKEQMATDVPEMMLYLTRMQGTLFDAVLRQNIEALDFLKRRFEHDRDLLSTLAKVDDPAKATTLWSDFWQNAIESYADEPRRLAEMMTKAAGDAVTKARDDANRLMQTTKTTAL